VLAFAAEFRSAAASPGEEEKRGLFSKLSSFFGKS